MSSSLLSDSILNERTPFSDDAVSSFERDAHAAAVRESQRQKKLEETVNKRNELLSSPDKMDSMVASSLEDVFPLTTKPKNTSFVKTENIDEALSKADHPFAGVGSAMKDSFAAALQRKDLLNASPAEVLSAVKRDMFAQKDSKGNTLLERGHQYKLDKDKGGIMSFHLSNIVPGMEPHSDKNTVALPGYEEYRQQHEEANTSLPEAVAFNTVATIAGIGLGAITGGALPAASVIGGRLAMAALTAYPEFKAFDAAVNAVNHSDFGKSEETGSFTKLAAELAAGAASLALTHKVGKFALDKSITAAIESGKIGEKAVAALKWTGGAPEAIAAFEARTNEAKTLAAVQEEAQKLSAKAIGERERSKEFLVLAGRQESELSTEEFLQKLHDERNPIIDPYHKEVMGVDDETLKAAKESPSILFGMIQNPEIEARVLEDIRGGMPAQQAALKGFKEEAALRLSAQGPQESVDFNKLMTGKTTSKTSEASYSKKVKVLSNGLDDLLTNTAPQVESPVKDLITGKTASESSVSKAEYSKTINIPKIEGLEGKEISKDAFGAEMGVTQSTSGPTAVSGNKTVKKTDMFGQELVVHDNFTVSNVEVYKGTGGKPAAKPTATGVNVVGLAGMGLLAGGMTLFGMPDQSEAGTISEAGKAVVDAGKKLLDGGLKVSHETIEKSAKYITSPKVSEAVLERVNKSKFALHDSVIAADIVTESMRAVEYKDVPTVLKSMEEMGIDTTHRVGYHGTPVTESTLNGHAEEFTRSGLYNDEGEFAKYFSHDPNVSEGYSGSSIEKPFLDIGKLYDNFYSKYGDGSTRFTNASIKFNNEKISFEELTKIGQEEFGLTPAELQSAIEQNQPNIQKSLLVVKKTYPMEGAVPEDVEQYLKNRLGDKYNGVNNTAHNAWQMLGLLGTNIQETFAAEISDVWKSVFTHDAAAGMTVYDKIEDLLISGKLPQSTQNRLLSIASMIESTPSTPKRAANDILRSLGYDSITHLGRGDGFVTIALKQGVEKPFFTGENLADKVLKSVAALAVSVPLMQLFSPDEANAAAAPLAGKVISTGLVEATKGAFESAKELAAWALRERYASETVKKGTTELPVMQRQYVTAPKIGRSVEAVNQKVGSFKTGFDGIAKFLSPYTFEKVYGAVDSGVSVQLAHMQNTVTNNVNNALVVAQSIIDNVKGIKPEDTKAIQEFMKPIQEEYDAVAVPLRGIELESEAANKVIENVKATWKEGKYADEDAQKLLKEQYDKLDNLKALYAELHPKFGEVDAKYSQAKDALIRKYSASRISFALDDPSIMENPEYKALFGIDERVAVAQFQKFYKDFKTRADSIGTDGLETITGAYNRHSRNNDAVNAALQDFLDKNGIRVGKGLPLTEFFSRSKYSRQMIPDIQRNVFEYVPDAERRIQGADFWRRGRQDGWWAFSQNEMIKSNKVWSDFFDRIASGMVPPPRTAINTIADRYAQVETLRLLGFLPSAPFKHFFKNVGTWATLGFTHSVAKMPESVVVATRNTVNEALRARGLEEKLLPKGAMDDFVRSMIKQRSMVNPLADLERPEVITSKIDQWLNNLNSAGGVGIKAVEAFDRTHTVLSAAEVAMNKGMTNEQAMYATIDTILKNNFMGGSLNPAWMHNPKIRMLALFQNTPFKILERRLIAARALGKDAYTAWGVVKSQKVEETLSQLMDLKYFIKSGENEFKKNLIYDALTGTKDVFGNSVSAQFMKEALITGAVLAGGSAVDADFERHTLHIPFFKSGTKEPVLSTSPIIDASWKTIAGEPSSGHPGTGVEFIPTTDDDKEFFFARFYRHWTSSTGGAQPLLLHKMKRISEDDIPKIYKDSIFKYLFAVPSHSTH